MSASNGQLARLDRPLWYGGPDPITLNVMNQMVANLRTLQKDVTSRTDPDPRRDLDDEFGYPKDGLSPHELRDLINREPVAAAVNDVYPLECFQVVPDIYEDEDAENITPWEQEVMDFAHDLEPEPGYNESDKGLALANLMLQADIRCGEARYGVIVIGSNDVGLGRKSMADPCVPSSSNQVTWVCALPEYQAEITAWEMDPGSRRYRWPTMYNVRFNDIWQRSYSGSPEPGEMSQVHWSRVVHICDTWHKPSSSHVLGFPRVDPVLNPILDCRKTRGGSNEGYYKACFPGISFETHPNMGGDVDVDIEGLKDMYEEYGNGFQRAFYLIGMGAKQLAPSVVDPSPHLLANIEAICMKMRVPKRIFLGGEMGERSTVEDRIRWNGRLKGRQTGFISPKIAYALMNRLINLGMLSKPQTAYRIGWPDIGALTDGEKADVLVKRTTAYGIYASQGVEGLVPPMDYMTKFDGMKEEEAKGVLDRTAEALEGDSDTAAPLLSMVGGVEAMMQMFDRFKMGAIGEETLKQLIMLFYKVDEEKAEEIIAEGMPEPPPGSPGDPNMMPALPPMKGPKSPTSVVNWYVENVLNDNVLSTTRGMTGKGTGKTGSGANCGTGAGGFKPGNTCAGDGAGTGTAGHSPPEGHSVTASDPKKSATGFVHLPTGKFYATDRPLGHADLLRRLTGDHATGENDLVSQAVKKGEYIRTQHGDAFGSNAGKGTLYIETTQLGVSAAIDWAKKHLDPKMVPDIHISVFDKTSTSTVPVREVKRSLTGNTQDLDTDLGDNVKTTGANCGIGAGGFQQGNHCAVKGGKGRLSAKAKIAKAAHKMVDKTIQRYAEEHNEPKIAAALGGHSLSDNEPVDIRAQKHGVELKTMVDNSNNKITMKRSAMELKAAWERKNKADVHTLVVDDQKVFNAKGEGKHDESQRVFYYRRGYGSFRVQNMHRVSSIEEVKALMDLRENQLPAAARRPKGQKRGKLS